MSRQDEHSHIPKADEFLVELIETKDGHHLFMYPFEGRLVHEVFSALMAYRISKLKQLTFTIAMNDYGFKDELKSIWKKVFTNGFPFPYKLTPNYDKS